MSDDANDSLIEKITELYHQFQQTLGKISHEHLEDSKQVIQQVDEAHQQNLRQKIQGQ
jgi:ElaB/YqjD/DUF883 family membrane-anchored ribosome-binding protein